MIVKISKCWLTILGLTIISFAHAGNVDVEVTPGEIVLPDNTCSSTSLEDGSCQSDIAEETVDVDVTDDALLECKDDNKSCAAWAEKGECEANPVYMYKKCRKSCELCSGTADKPSECKDENQHCAIWAEQGECDNNSKYMHKKCPKSCEICSIYYPPQLLARGIDFGEIQKLTDAHNATESSLVLEHIHKTRERLEQIKKEKIVSDELIESCRNNHEDCTIWALNGECENNPGYMHSKCAPACQICEMLDPSVRCPPYDPEVTPGAWQPGDLNAMFERLTTEPYQSRYQVEIISRDPWVIVMDNVLNEEEATRMIDLGSNQGYKRSTGVGKARPDGTFEAEITESRTSSNTWCDEECMNDDIGARVIERLSNITEIPSNNSECLQMLRYEVGEFYKSHHDFMPGNKEKQQGVRMLTMYLYLNDVEAGGGTKFTSLNATVMPKLGRAVLWPSVLNESPHEIDDRTDHEALPVEAGVKYGANAWFHQYDFQTPYSKGCSG